MACKFKPNLLYCWLHKINLPFMANRDEQDEKEQKQYEYESEQESKEPLSISAEAEEEDQDREPVPISVNSKLETNAVATSTDMKEQDTAAFDNGFDYEEETKSAPSDEMDYSDQKYLKKKLK